MRFFEKKARSIILVTGVLVVLCTNISFAQIKNVHSLPVLTVDAARPEAKFKPINGVNGGPRTDMGNYYDNSKYFRAMQPPFVRLHDVPYAAMGAVDIHHIII